MTTGTSNQAQAPRDRALQRLRKRQDFWTHVIVYLLVNSFIVIIWAITGPKGFFWPVFPIAGWAIGLVMNAWDVFWRPQITEEEIQHEIDRENRSS